MPLYQSKPRRRRAEQFLLGRPVPPGVTKLPAGSVSTGELPASGLLTVDGFIYFVTTIHGQRAFLAPGDWVVEEPDGVHYYPVKPEIFEQSWEEVGP